ncbi:MAG: gephyrin-like molybdotransferase Glp [Chloroflexota bacterium]|jgi:molybdenum cofactor synthesis domain-containing protein
MQRESAWPMVRVAEALQVVSDISRTPLGIEMIAPHLAAGRVLAETVLAPADMPAEPRATVDGYAIRTSDGDGPRQVIAELTAGSGERIALAPGQATRIMTGAPLPTGADAAVMVERTQEVNGVLTYQGSVRAGECVLPVGSDMRLDDVVIPAGSTISAGDVGLLTNIGLSLVAVYRRPVVAVLSTGDEVYEYDELLPYGGVRDSNRHALMAAIQAAGCEARSLGIARDDQALQRRKIMDGLTQADVLITSGGVSMGTKDFIKPLLTEIGTVHFGRIAFKPGKPTMCATVGERIMFGLPGNPVSSLVSFEVFVRPALRRLMGDATPDRPRVWVHLTESITPSPDRPEYQRAIVRWQDGRLVASTTGAQGSSRLLSMRAANALLVIAPGEERLAVGSQVEALIVGEIR